MLWSGACFGERLVFEIICLMKSEARTALREDVVPFVIAAVAAIVIPAAFISPSRYYYYCY